MKIVIQSGKTKFFLILPTPLILNRFTAVIAALVIKIKWPSIGIRAEDFMEMIRSIKKYKKDHGRWEAVNISSVHGEVVYISL